MFLTPFFQPSHFCSVRDLLLSVCGKLLPPPRRHLLCLPFPELTPVPPSAGTRFPFSFLRFCGLIRASLPFPELGTLSHIYFFHPFPPCCYTSFFFSGFDFLIPTSMTLHERVVARVRWARSFWRFQVALPCLPRLVTRLPSRFPRTDGRRFAPQPPPPLLRSARVISDLKPSFPNLGMSVYYGLALFFPLVTPFFLVRTL